MGVDLFLFQNVQNKTADCIYTHTLMQCRLASKPLRSHTDVYQSPAHIRCKTIDLFEGTADIIREEINRTPAYTNNVIHNFSIPFYKNSGCTLTPAHDRSIDSSKVAMIQTKLIGYPGIATLG